MLTFNTLRRVSLFVFGFIAAVAWAHVDTNVPHEHVTFFSGMAHPFSGLDHLAAMVAVGVWSALALRQIWLAPAVFVSAMGAGIELGAVGFDHSAIEPMIAISVIVMGLLVGARHALSVRIALILIGVFGFCHGAAHGIALKDAVSAAPVLGMLLSTMMLHTMGVFLGQRALTQRIWLQRLSGGVLAAIGLALLSSFA